METAGSQSGQGDANLANVPGITLHCRTVLLDDTLSMGPLVIFHGYCDAQGRRWCSTRLRDWATGDSKVALDGKVLDSGEDPRICEHNGWPLIVSVVATPGLHPRTYIIEIGPHGHRRSLLLTPPQVVPGKNYAPFTYPDGKHGIVHSYEPPLILRETGREEGIVLLSAAQGRNPKPPEMGPHGFSAFRGGTNGLPYGPYILGIGHTTRHLPGLEDRDGNSAELGFHHFRHRPFGWLLDPATNEMRFFEVDGPYPDRFDCIDPTSIIARSQHSFELFTTEVERHYHDRGSRRQVASYRLDLGPEFLAAAERSFQPNEPPSTPARRPWLSSAFIRRWRR